MKNTLRALLRPLIPLLRWFWGHIFDRSIMVGPYFDNSFVGYRQLHRAFWRQKIMGFNRGSPWPMAHTTTISDYQRLHFHPADLNNLNSPGCYFQNFDADITLGEGCYISPNVGLITANHDPSAVEEHLPGSPVVVGAKSWVGMNATVLPGVTLGPSTIVGAGSVVTKSFPDGWCVIAGNPARVIKQIARAS